MNKLLLKAGVLALALSSIVPAMTTPVLAQADPADQNRAIAQFCRDFVAANDFDSPQFGNCIGYYKSAGHAEPAQRCKFFREVGLIQPDRFNECVAFLKELGL